MSANCLHVVVREPKFVQIVETSPFAAEKTPVMSISRIVELVLVLPGVTTRTKSVSSFCRSLFPQENMPNIEQRLDHSWGDLCRGFVKQPTIPPRISVVDAVAAITGKSHDVATQDFRRMHANFCFGAVRIHACFFIDAFARAPILYMHIHNILTLEFARQGAVSLRIAEVLLDPSIPALKRSALMSATLGSTLSIPKMKLTIFSLTSAGAKLTLLRRKTERKTLMPLCYALRSPRNWK